MKASQCLSGRLWTLKVLCVFYSTTCLLNWPLHSEAAKLRCGTDLLNDLLFVCGDRGIYFGKGTRSGYASRPRGKGIVDKCCRSNGCDLHHLEVYCAKPKKQQQTTAWPSTSTGPYTTKQTDVANQFRAVFHKRVLEHLGPPNSPKREAYRKKTKPSFPKKTKVSSTRRKMKLQHTTSGPPSRTTARTLSF
ncbi:insulin-like growth factor 3 [Dunckerocampus dactyliophorus]|uniref:insulin-like growth factor 3 n=1 Tax=Dunckerocampus dactyliophorus TaxID=161453 RepID=UPI002407462D|nr:insulin-like growth factor 3 [Dunckerocampus dactyliophorus]